MRSVMERRDEKRVERWKRCVISHFPKTISGDLDVTSKGCAPQELALDIVKW